MTHEHVIKSVEKQTGRASATLALTLKGGVLAHTLLIAPYSSAELGDEQEAVR